MDPHHIARACALIAVSFFFLPLSASLLALSYVRQLLVRSGSSRRILRQHPAFRPKTVLVTGAGTATGLKISRALYEAGHNVIGADFELDGVPSYAQFSKAFRRFYPLRLPNKSYGAWLYIQDLLRVVQKEKVKLWINCSERISGLEDAQAREVLGEKTDCACVALGSKDASHFSNRTNFLAFTKSLGLPTPELHAVRSRAEVHNVLSASHGKKKYILNTSDLSPRANSKALMLPRRTLSQTYQQVATVMITKDSPMVLEQHFENTERYISFAIIARGELTAFAASPVTDTSSSCQAIRTTIGIGRAMLLFMQAFAQRAGEHFTAHLSVEFRVQEKGTDKGFEASVLPVACNTQPGLAALLFSGINGSLDIGKAYLDVIEIPRNGVLDLAESSNGTNGNGQLETAREILTPSPHQTGIYFIGQDIITLVLGPLLHLVKFEIGLLQLLQSFVMFANHVIFWREGTYAMWDSLPFFMLYHVFLPIHLVLSLFKSKPWTMSIP